MLVVVVALVALAALAAVVARPPWGSLTALGALLLGFFALRVSSGTTA